MNEMRQLIELEKDFIQWMVMGPDYEEVDSFQRFGHGIDLDVQYPRKGDGFEVSLSYRYGNCKFLMSLAFLRSKLKYWCDVTKANKLIITSPSSKGWDINVITVYLDRGNALFENLKKIGHDLHMFHSALTEFVGSLDLVSSEEERHIKICLINEYKVNHKESFNYKDFYEELMKHAYHPDRFIDWCYDEDQKKSLYEFVE